MNQIKQLIKETKRYLTKYDYDKVIEYCDKILEIDPESSFGLRFNGIAHFQSGDYTKGLEYYCRLYEVSSDEDTGYTIAYLYEKLGMYDKAMEFYDANSNEGWVQSKRKRLLTKMKSYQPVIDEYDDKLRKLDDSDTLDNIQRKIVYLEEKAVFQYRNREYQEALESFKKALMLYQSINPEFLSYYQKEDEKWYKMLQKYIDKNHHAINIFKELFNYNANADLWSKKIKNGSYQYEDAIVYCDLLLELNPNNIDLLGVCARRYESVDYDYSLECWNKILEMEAENVEAINEILDLYSHQYRKDKSLKLIDQKLYIDDIHSQLLFRKIKLLESMTLYTEALSVYDEYLSTANTEQSTRKALTDYDKIRCMEAEALEYYLDNNLEESYNIFKEVSESYINIRKSRKYWSSESQLDKWYMVILADCVKQSENNPQLFFEKFFKVNDRTIESWLTKIGFLNNQNVLGNPITYCNILLDKNRNNIRLLLTKARIYYTTERLDKALNIYNKLIKVGNNEAKNYKFNILVMHHQYIKAYEILKSMEIEYSIVRKNLSVLAKKLLKNGKYEESLYVYEKIYEVTHATDNVCQIKYLLRKLGYIEKLEESPYYMNWIDLINFKYESDNCPRCKNKLTPILYGYSSPEAMKRADKGEIILGGCCVSFHDPTHHCIHCGEDVYMGTYKIDITYDDLDLSYYTTGNIHWITRYIEEHPNNTIREIEREAEKIGIDHRELGKFMKKLEEKII